MNDLLEQVGDFFKDPDILLQEILPILAMNMQMGTKLTLENNENGLSLDLSAADSKAEAQPWDAFELVANYVDPIHTDELEESERGLEPDYLVYENNTFSVLVRLIEYKDPRNDKVWLSIKRHDRTSDVGWRDLQAIKNRLCGTACVGLEIYPEHRKVVDTCNQYHLWVHRPNVEIDFGYQERLVCIDDEDVERQASVLRDKGVHLESMPPQETYLPHHIDTLLDKVGPAWKYYHTNMQGRYHGTNTSNDE